MDDYEMVTETATVDLWHQVEFLEFTEIVVNRG